MKKINLIGLSFGKGQLLTKEEKNQVLGGKMRCLDLSYPPKEGELRCPQGYECISGTCERPLLPM